jgi:5-methylcytosine-specific restriction endonuclease McrA
VKRRDGGCVRCLSASRLHVHHILPFADHPNLRLDPDNLVTLCRLCHHAEHRKGVKP